MSHATMFDEQFSFGTTRSSSLDSSNGSTTCSSRERSVSPCSAVTALPPPAYTMTDLAATLGRSRIRQDAQICYDSCEAYANTDDDAGWQLDPIPTIEVAPQPMSRARTLPPRPHSPSRRSQRQSNSRTLCSSSHQQDIAALIARMVYQEEQCSVTAAGPLDSVPTAIDEGYDSSDCSEQPSSRRSSLAVLRSRPDNRRSSELKLSGACVKKAIRMRKDKLHKRKTQ